MTGESGYSWRKIKEDILLCFNRDTFIDGPSSYTSLIKTYKDFPFVSNSEGTLVGKCLYCNLLTVESAV